MFDENKITVVNESSSEPILFTVYIVPPTFQITSPQNATYNTTDIRVTLEINNPTYYLDYPTTFAYVLDNASTNYDRLFYYSSSLFTGLTNGSHNVTVYAFGTNKTVFFTINAIPTISPSPILTVTPSASVLEFPTWTILTMTATATLVTTMIARRRKR